MMTNSLEYKPSFFKDVKRFKRKHPDLGSLAIVLHLLEADDIDTLKRRYKDHQLKGNLRAFHDVHVEADLVLLYERRGSVITLHRLATHDTLKL